MRIDEIAERYVRLVLEAGRHDPALVDAYYGPDAWRREAEASARPALAVARDLCGLAHEVGGLVFVRWPEDGAVDGETLQRGRCLYTQLVAVRTRLMQVQAMTGAGGVPFSIDFDTESRWIYRATAPVHEPSFFEEALADLDVLLPGPGALAERYERYREDFVIPPGRLSAVFDAAIAECRARTRARLVLPGDETFVVEYVGDKPWSGYNWYKGAHHSVIQVNTDLPIHIDRAVDLAAHEGYPGHHVYNVLLESSLVRDRGWTEYMVYPLFSPQSLIAEGTANFGIEVVLPADDRLLFERDVLMPLAGLDGSRTEEYHRVLGVASRLAYAGNEAARRYVNGELDRDGAVDWLVRYTLSSPARALQRTRFFDAYRSYVINYNLGQDLVRGYVHARGGTPEQPDRRWALFLDLLLTPREPTQLQ